MSSFGFGNPGGLDQASLSQYAAMGGHGGYDMYKGRQMGSVNWGLAVTPRREA